MLDAEKTPPQGPFAINLARIEGKVDSIAATQREHVAHYRTAINVAMSAERTARTALWARASWGPYVVSGLAFALGFAAFVVACGGK